MWENDKFLIRSTSFLRKPLSCLKKTPAVLSIFLLLFLFFLACSPLGERHVFPVSRAQLRFGGPRGSPHVFHVYDSRSNQINLTYLFIYFFQRASLDFEFWHREPSSWSPESTLDLWLRGECNGLDQTSVVFLHRQTCVPAAAAESNFHKWGSQEGGAVVLPLCRPTGGLQQGSRPTEASWKEGKRLRGAEMCFCFVFFLLPEVL